MYGSHWGKEESPTYKWVYIWSTCSKFSSNQHFRKISAACVLGAPGCCLKSCSCAGGTYRCNLISKKQKRSNTSIEKQCGSIMWVGNSQQLLGSPFTREYGNSQLLGSLLTTGYSRSSCLLCCCCFDVERMGLAICPKVCPHVRHSNCHKIGGRPSFADNRFT